MEKAREMRNMKTAGELPHNMRTVPSKENSCVPHFLQTLPLHIQLSKGTRAKNMKIARGRERE